jgi:hypothetical protein
MSRQTSQKTALKQNSERSKPRKEKEGIVREISPYIGGYLLFLGTV